MTDENRVPVLIPLGIYKVRITGISQQGMITTKIDEGEFVESTVSFPAQLLFPCLVNIEHVRGPTDDIIRTKATPIKLDINLRS